MKRTSLGSLVLQLLVAVLALGCEAEKAPSKPTVGDEPEVPSRPGIVQVGGPNDVMIDETSACARFQAALQSGVTRLECKKVPVGECPELVHPLVDLPCIMYSEPSVAQCESIFAAAATCDDLGPGSCVLTAILDPTDSSGMPIECADDGSNSTDTNSTDSTAPDGSTLPADAALDAGLVDGAADAHTRDAAGDSTMHDAANDAASVDSTIDGAADAARVTDAASAEIDGAVATSSNDASAL